MAGPLGDFVQVRCSKVTEKNEDIFRLRKLSTGMQIKANRVKKKGAKSVCKNFVAICMIGVGKDKNHFFS